MPKAYDAQRLTITHDPTQRLPFELGKLPKFDVSHILDGLVQAIKDLTGIDLSSFTSLFEGILGSIGLDLPALAELNPVTLLGQYGDWIAQLQDLLEGFPDDPGAVLAYIEGAIADALEGVPLLGDIVNALTGAGGGLPDLTSWAQQLLNGQSPLNALNLFGLVRPGNIPLIGVGHLGDTSPNLLTNPRFENAVSLNGSGVWTWDSSTGHAGAGSAKTVANGTGSRDLLSNAIAVTKGQKLACSCWVKWADVTSAGGTLPLQLGITAYLNGDAVGQPYLARHAASPTTSDWLQLSGTYTVPDGVDEVRVRLTVTPDATAGTVWFDDISAAKTGLLQTSLIADANGNGLPDVLDSLGADISTALTDLGTKVAQGDFQDLLGTLGGNLTAIGDRLASFLTPNSTLNASNIGTGQVADGFVPGIGSILDNLVTHIFNLPDAAGFTHTDAAAAISAQTAAITGISAQLQQIANDRTSGVAFGDDFERTANNLGSNWDVLYANGNGSVGTPNGHDASWLKSLGDNMFTARYNAQATSGDYQRVTVVLGSAPETPNLLGFPTGNPAWNHVCCRMSADKKTRVEARFGNGQVKIVRVVNLVETELNSGPCAAPGPGSSITIEAGKPGTARYFRALLNNSPVLDITEVGTASQLGAGYQWTGMGGRAGALLLTQSAPGRAKQWTAADQ